ncbi:glycosyltransferase family 39 protein [Tardiphaga sp.]|uniref:ArnT family glycosyltransferase n=1 Tax=Tardiphaga sp. TaxID=1926292 RepID=UPI0025D5E881|nr:glycosyltransferase family 39 protein [Tardiphaga sp.]
MYPERMSGTTKRSDITSPGAPMTVAASDRLHTGGWFSDRAVAVTGIAVFAVVTALYLILPFWSLGLHIPLNPNEGWNALQSERALGPGALYPDGDAFFFNNYPPLSFYIVGLFGQAIGDNILAGRILSLIATFVIAGNIVWIVRNLGGSSRYAIFAGLLFLGILSKSYTLYVGVDDPQLLAHAVMSAGFAVFTGSRPGRGRLAAAAALMVTAGMIKHNIFAMPLAATTWLLVNDRRAAERWVIYAATCLVAAFALCWLSYGAAFFDQLGSPRSYSLYRVVTLLGWIQGFIIPLVVWAIFAARVQSDSRVSLVNHLLAAGAIAFAVTRTGEGVSVNSFFDWIIGASIATGLVLSRLAEMPNIERYGVVRMRAVIVGLLCLRLIVLPQNELVKIVLGTELAASTRAQDHNALLDIALMRQLAGPAICEELTLCYWSGHPSAYDEFNAGQAFKTRARDINVLRQQITAGRYRLIQLAHNSPLLDATRAAGLVERTRPGGQLIFAGEAKAFGADAASPPALR